MTAPPMTPLGNPPDDETPASSEIRAKRPLLAICVLSVLAMVNGLYLTLVHIDLEVGARGVGSMCHALARQGCSITGGRYGAFFGTPTALFGFAAAVATFGLSFRAIRTIPSLRQPWLIWLGVLSLVSVLSSVAMGFISLLAHSYCPFCVLWYGLNFAGAAAAAIAWRGRSSQQAEPAGTAVKGETVDLPEVGMLAGITFTVALICGQYAYQAILAPRMAERAAEVATKIQQLKALPRVTIRVDGVALKPSAEANLIVFSDFECPHCSKLWRRLAELPAHTKRRLHTTHLHFPLDSACHTKIGYPLHKRACAAAWAAECARDAGQYHAYATLLFDHQRDLADDDLQAYAQELDLDLAAFDRCRASDRVRKRVRAHLQAGFDVKARGTPMLFVNGVSFPVNLPAPLLAGAIEALLAK